MNLHEIRHEDSGCSNSPKVSRREWFRRAAGGSAGLALGTLIDLPAVRADTSELKLSEVSEFTSSCNFCSSGCGMVASVRDGKLIAMEGDYDHIVNRGSLCVKGISMFSTHTSPNRLANPLYRAPGSDHWEEIVWEDAVERIAQKIRKTRDATWVATEKVGTKDVPVNRTDAQSPSWAAHRTLTKSAICSRKRRACSAYLLSNTRPDFDTALRSPVWGPHSGGVR